MIESKIEPEAVEDETITVRLALKTGADVDIAIDTETVEEYDRIANQHYERIHERYPSCRLVKLPKGDSLDDPRHNWEIVSDDVTFRTVEMYRGSYSNIMSHHVGMVCGAYTAALNRAAPPTFYVSARFGLSMNDLATPNYFYFASRKVAPQHVIMKYANRGFGFGSFPRGIRAAIGATFIKDPLWNRELSPGACQNTLCGNNDITKGSHCYPAMMGKGCFSAYSLLTELCCAWHKAHARIPPFGKHKAGRSARRPT